MLTHSSPDECLDRLQFFAIINKTSIKIFA